MKRPISIRSIIIIGAIILLFTAAIRWPREIITAWGRLKHTIVKKYYDFQTDRNMGKIENLIDNASPSEPREDSGLNLLFIIIDTCRSDRLSCYGYPEITTPNIDSLAESGTRFSTVVSQAPVTMPSHCSIFTSLYPPTHGVRDNGSFKLNESFNTMAEILQRNGYMTGAVVGSFVLDSRFGLDQGFNHYHDTFKKPGSPRFHNGRWQGHDIDIFESSADEVTLEALRWLDEHRRTKSFLFLNYYDPHEPCTPPSRFMKAFPGNPYNGEVAFVDECISYIIRYLEKSGLADNTMIVITADHGESLGEHDYTGHADVLYDQVLLVPWIIYDPRRTATSRSIDRQVNSVDIMPTVLDLLGIKVPEGIHGVSRANLMDKEPTGVEETSYAETLFPLLRGGEAEIHTLRTPTWKLVRYIKADGGERNLLFNLIEDRDETLDLIDRYPDIAGWLSEELDKYRRLDSPERFNQMTPVNGETRKKLKALGYI